MVALRAAKYRRISDDREGLKLGIDRQDEDLDELAEKRGYVVVASYHDNDIGASTRSKKKRPDYDRMLRDAKAGKFDVIIAYTSKRLTRRPRENEDLIELAEKYGTRYDYVRSPSFDLNTANGRMIARMLAAQDANESEEIGERVSRARKQQAQNGQYGGGRRPFGWEVDGVTQIESECEVIRSCSLKLVNDPPRKVNGKYKGTTLAALARDLRASEIPTVTGKAWSAETLRDILIRPRNAGRSEYKGDVVREDAWGGAVVPPDIYDRVCEILTDSNRKTQSGRAPKWLGSGIYQCGVCNDGATMQVTSGGRNPRYVCKVKSHLARSARHVDEHVINTLIDRLSERDAVTMLAPPPPDVDVSALRSERKAKTRKLASLGEDYAADLIPRSTMLAGVRDAQARIAEIDSLLAQASNHDPLLAWVNAVDPWKLWEVASLEDKRDLLRRVVRVVILPAKRGTQGFDPDCVSIQRIRKD